MIATSSDHTPNPLMERVDALRALSRQREVSPLPLPPFAAEARRVKPGLFLIEHRFPLGYLKRHLAQARTPSLPFSAGDDRASLVCLCPALLDDGLPRLFLAGIGQISQGQFVLRQAFVAGPGAEGLLLFWLEKELGEHGAILCAEGAGKALLMSARGRQGRDLALPWNWQVTKGCRASAPVYWRALDSGTDSGTDTGTRLLEANRRALLTLARRQLD